MCSCQWRDIRACESWHRCATRDRITAPHILLHINDLPNIITSVTFLLIDDCLQYRVIWIMKDQIAPTKGIRCSSGMGHKWGMTFNYKNFKSLWTPIQILLITRTCSWRACNSQILGSYTSHNFSWFTHTYHHTERDSNPGVPL